VKEITSPQNSLIRSLVQLQEKSRARRQSGQFLIEGRREISLAAKAGYAIDYILSDRTQIDEIGFSGLDAEHIAVSPEVYARLAYRDSTEGIIAVARAKKHLLSDLHFPANPLVLVAEAPEKPGNIGALLRTADAAGIDAVIIANPKTDLYNPNIIRSSVGGIFTVPIATGGTNEIIAFLKARNISVYAAILQQAVSYDSIDYTPASAIVVGTEDTGLSEDWRKAATRNIIIPMHGAIDSMNVSVAAGILVFEAKRQRGFGHSRL
jgi:TrmH family RNA methyltransferase